MISHIWSWADVRESVSHNADLMTAPRVQFADGITISSVVVPEILRKQFILASHRKERQCVYR